MKQCFGGDELGAKPFLESSNRKGGAKLGPFTLRPNF